MSRTGQKGFLRDRRTAIGSWHRVVDVIATRSSVRYYLAILLVSGATGIAALARGRLSEPDIVILYLLSIMVVAFFLGRGPSLLAAALSVAAYNFFFVPPLLTFTIEQARHVLTFVMMFVVGLTVSGLASRLRKQERDARRREERTAALYSLTQELAGLTDETLLAQCSARHAAEALGTECTVCLRDADGKSLVCEASKAPAPAGLRRAARQPAPHQSVGQVRFEVGASESGEVTFASQGPTNEEERAFLRAFARQVSLAAERARLAHAAESASLRARAEEARNSLLSAVSHDLRTPLATITGAGTALRGDGGQLDAEQRAELLESICGEAERMDRHIEKILDMARLGEGGLSPAREWVPLEEVVGSTLDRLDEKLIGREVTVDLPEDLPFVWVDPVLLEHVLSNLIENAIEHAGPTSPIDISARRGFGGFEITVADRGPGIPKGAERSIFERFVRGPGARGGGVGLGLAICQAVANAHGGSIVGENRSSGGAAFRITLPLPPEPPTTESARFGALAGREEET